MTDVDIRVVDPGCAEAQTLIVALDEDLSTRYPGMPPIGIDIADFLRAGGVFVVAWNEGEPAACGALRRYDADRVEIKRMYVAPHHRRRGLSRALLTFLEAEATRRGFARLMIETGDKQPEAVALYESAGYEHIAAFGPYIGNPWSVCFAKALLCL